MTCFERVKEFYRSVAGEKKVIGKSCLGREIFAVKLGEGTPVGIVQCGIHGREFITSRLAVSQYRYGQITGSVWFLPLTNPDGALISESGEKPLWKANARGVDLNVNFDADWGKGAKNVFHPASENYVGAYPFSEPETRALRDFTLWAKPNYTVSYHTKGEEIYSRFKRELPGESVLGAVLSKSTGYPIVRTVGSVGGYKDWCIERLKVPSFTVEVGSDLLLHPIREEHFWEIERRNVRAIADLSAAWELSVKK